MRVPKLVGTNLMNFCILRVDFERDPRVAGTPLYESAKSGLIKRRLNLFSRIEIQASFCQMELYER